VLPCFRVFTIRLGNQSFAGSFSSLKRLLIIGTIGLGLIVGNLAIGATAPEPALQSLLTVHRLETGQPVRIVCFGDSVTGVYYHTGGRRAWCDLLGLALQRRYPAARIEMINAGLGGQSTVDALPRLDTDVLAVQPNLVVLMFGLNDVTRVAPELYRANLRNYARRIRAAGAEVMFMTPNAVEPGDEKRPPERVAAYAEIMREAGRGLQVPVADAYAAFLAVQTSRPAEWMRLMSDAIHPNLRGHVLLAETAASTLTGQPEKLGDLPVLFPRLPHTLACLRAGEPLQVIAMKPFDALIAPALRKLFPGANVHVTPWDPAGKSLPELEAEAKQAGWWKFRDHPKAARPNLVVVVVPADASAATREKAYRSYAWVLNWSQDVGKPTRWDCLAVLPSVAQPGLNDAQRAAEELAREVILDKDLPMIQRAPGEAADTAEIFSRQLAELLRPAGP
jgi:lysophospholipase L1-like esterase